MGRPYAPVRAPMVGTFAAQHVENGARVAEGDVVGETESMKMLTQLTAPIAGEVEFVVSLGETVGEGDIIAKIYPA